MKPKSLLGQTRYWKIPTKPFDRHHKVDDYAPIHHYKISITGINPRKNLYFGVFPKETIPENQVSIRDYALSIAQSHQFPQPVLEPLGSKEYDEYLYSLTKLSGADTPYDIDKLEGKPCWILIELDQDVNWEFTPGSVGISTKMSRQRENYGLEYVFKKRCILGAQSTPPIVQVPPNQRGKDPDRCKVVYWAVPRRPKMEKRGFNFYIDFWQMAGRKTWRLPTVFDPNVPNSGGAGIPS